MEYNMMLLNISFDELMLQCVCVCIVQEKNGAKSAGKKNFLGRLLIADLKTTFLSRLDVPQALTKTWTS